MPPKHRKPSGTGTSVEIGQEQLTGLQTQITVNAEDTQAHVVTLTDSIGIVAVDLDNTKADLSVVSTDVGKVNNKVDSLNTDLKAVDAKVTTIDTKVTIVDTKVETVSKRVDTIEVSVNKMSQ